MANSSSSSNDSKLEFLLLNLKSYFTAWFNLGFSIGFGFTFFGRSLGKISLNGLRITSHDLMRGGFKGLSFSSTVSLSIPVRLKKVSPVTFPNIVCFLSSHEHLSFNVIKNWLQIGRASCRERVSSPV